MKLDFLSLLHVEHQKDSKMDTDVMANDITSGYEIEAGATLNELSLGDEFGLLSPSFPGSDTLPRMFGM